MHGASTVVVLVLVASCAPYRGVAPDEPKVRRARTTLAGFTAVYEAGAWRVMPPVWTRAELQARRLVPLRDRRRVGRRLRPHRACRGDLVVIERR